MSQHRYPARVLIGDYVRAGVGLAIAGGLWWQLPQNLHIELIFGGLTLLFLAFTMRTAWRQKTVVELADDAIRVAPPNRPPLVWAELRGLKLRYFSTRRSRDKGWMSMVLTGPGGRVSLDSDLSDFEAVVGAAARAARANGLSLSRATAGNLRALGIDWPEDAAR